jgi:preprotein translocase subunit SecA
MGFFSRLFEVPATSIVGKVRKLEARLRDLPDEALRERFGAARAKVAGGAHALTVLPEVFACVVVAAERAIGMRHFDVQVQGGVELARGKVAEMRTGEGKTLVATLPAALHALAGKGVHVVTVNDYLARRDAEWMGPVYERLGLTVGCVQEVMAADRAGEVAARREQYARDVTYVTNSEVVFDFLRDNLAYRPGEVVQRPAYYAIVDEVDLLLVDEAQTPLIIAGPGHEDPTLIRQADAVLRGLEARRHFKVDRKTRTASLTDEGLTAVEHALEVGSLADPAFLPWAHAAYQALQAWAVFERDVQYIVAGDEIHIVDEHTGRVSPEKRYSNGLHQALEAKEGLTIRSENVTLAKTSYQHYFRGYPGLCGMTGTAWSERDELRTTYRLDVARIPTHRAMVRKDFDRVVYLTADEKRDAAVEEIVAAREAGRPVLVGTVSVEESEAIAARLVAAGVEHEVLNARRHDREAQVVAQAGRPGAVTISTNMAGRGTDIALGGGARELAAAEARPGTPEYLTALRRHEAACAADRERVVAAGGLLVVGTGEHESIRIDDQLRGRAGRQGDPGSSVLLVSLEDAVYRRFGEQKVLPLLFEALGEWPEGTAIGDPHVHEALEELRRKVEIENQAIRRDLFKYDSIVHDRRERIWGWRRSLLHDEGAEAWRGAVRELVDDLLGRLEEEVDAALEAERGARGAAPSARERWRAILERVLGWLPRDGLDDAAVVERDAAVGWLVARYDGRFGISVSDEVRAWERQVLLDVVDTLWPEYLHDLERVEEGIWLRSYAQVDPFVELRKEAARMFGDLLRDIELNALRAWLAFPPAGVGAADGSAGESGGGAGLAERSFREVTASRPPRLAPAPGERVTRRR